MRAQGTQRTLRTQGTQRTQHLLLIVGSPRKNGTSYTFCRTIADLAKEAGHIATITFAIDYFDKRKPLDELSAELLRSDVVGVVTPLYVDHLPYPMIWLLEKLAANSRTELKGRGLFAIGQCGFPDPSLMGSVLESCRLFAAATGMTWLSGIGYGGGPLINGAPLETLGNKGKRITRALSILVSQVMAGSPTSTEVQNLIIERIPKILYHPLAWLMNAMARSAARKQGTDLYRKFYWE